MARRPLVTSQVWAVEPVVLSRVVISALLKLERQLSTLVLRQWSRGRLAYRRRVHLVCQVVEIKKPVAWLGNNLRGRNLKSLTTLILMIGTAIRARCSLGLKKMRRIVKQTDPLQRSRTTSMDVVDRNAKTKHVN